jgi:hypothetical protein
MSYVLYHQLDSRYLISAVGVMLGFALIQPSDIQDMHAQLTILMDEYDISLPQLPDFDFTRVDEEWKRLRSNIPELWKFNRDGREFQVGESMKARGLTAEYPVVLIPGVVSTVCLSPFMCAADVTLRCLTESVLSNIGTGIVVYISRLSRLLPRETLGWL